jgi:hypothetical protein
LGKKSSPKTKIVAYHKVKRRFLPLGEIQGIDPDLKQICVIILRNLALNLKLGGVLAFHNFTMFLDGI